MVCLVHYAPEVSGVQREAVTSVEAAAGLVRRAAAARAVEATQMNAVSSRSHTIFMLYITVWTSGGTLPPSHPLVRLTRRPLCAPCFLPAPWPRTRAYTAPGIVPRLVSSDPTGRYR